MRGDGSDNEDELPEEMDAEPVEETDDPSAIDAFLEMKSQMKENLLERTGGLDDEDDFDDDDEDDSLDDEDDADDTDEEEVSDAEMPADQLSEETSLVRVEATYDAGVFPENTTLELTDVPKEEVMEAVSGVLDDVIDVVAVDITFLSESGEELEPENNGTVAVSLSLNEPLQEGTQTIVHIDDNGGVEVLDGNKVSEATETEAQFVADAFSTYAVATQGSGSTSYQTVTGDDGFVFEVLSSSTKLSLDTVPGTSSVTVPSTVTANSTSYTVTKVLGSYNGSSHSAVAGGASTLTNLTLASTITEIGASAFSNYTALKSVSLPQNLTTIGANAFSGCSSLNSVFIPSSVTSIGSGAFGTGTVIYGYTGSKAASYASSNNLTFISVGSSSPSGSGNDSTSNNSGTTKNTGTTNSDSDDDDDDSSSSSSSSTNTFSTGDTKTAGSGYNKAEYEKTGSSTVTFNESEVSSSSKIARVPGTVKISSTTYKVTEVAEEAFSGYKSLKKVKIGVNVEELGENMISDCPKLTKLVINSKKLTADGVKGSLKGSNVKKIVVPSSMVKTYEKIFTKSNTGSKTTLVVKAHPTAKTTSTSTTKSTGSKSSSSSTKTTGSSNSSTKSSGSSSSSTTKSTGSTGSTKSTSSTTKTTGSTTSSGTKSSTGSSASGTTTKKTTSSTTGKTTSKSTK